MVHHAKARTQALSKFILDNVVGHKTAFEISDVKQDGTVFVKFRSYMEWPAMSLASDFNRALCRSNLLFTQTSDKQIRLALDQFAHEEKAES